LAALGHEPLTLDALGRAPFVGQVLHETLRLYPPAWIVARYTVADDELCGIRVPAGHLAIVSPWATHRRPELFDDPERFDPDRFPPGEGTTAYPKFAYFPFGGGPRICIGNGFALMEAQLVLATLRRRFRLTLAPGARIEPLPLLTLRCTHGVPARVEAV
jgi:cytochrome P450